MVEIAPLCPNFHGFAPDFRVHLVDDYHTSRGEWKLAGSTPLHVKTVRKTPV